MSFFTFLLVGLGGALGAILRYSISLIPLKADFPILTLITNLLGAILIGFIVGLTTKNPNMKFWANPLLKTGFCGGFTTFSTFSLETLLLYEETRYVEATLYAILSLLLCVAGVIIGRKLADCI